MRFLAPSLAMLVLATPALASADVWQDRYIPCEPTEDGVIALTSSSRILYVNDCLPNGCVVRSGQDSSLTDASTIAPQGATVTMEPYMHGQEHWDDVIECVKETFSMFDITVVTEDPGPNVPHYEVMAAGTSANLNPDISGAGGIAPFISCGAQRNNLLSFVFANQTASVEYLCAAIAHEAGHTYGLSHSLNPKDPMTYMDLGSHKEWQNAEQTCGTDAPQNCRCFDDTQNSFRYLMNTFGLRTDLAPATLTILNPKHDAWVKPGFGISAAFSSPLDTLSAEMSFDNGTPVDAANGVLAWNAPAMLSPGGHRVTVNAADFADRAVSATLTVNVVATCGNGETCPEGFPCLGGYCLPGPGIDSGLGAACETGSDCVTGSCMSDGATSLCTGTCDAGGSCPAGFTCIEGANLCWPAQDSGGCSVGGSPATFAPVLGLLFLVRRRRR